MAKIAITVEIEDVDYATDAVMALGWDIEDLTWRGTVPTMRLAASTQEVSSVVRMLAMFWTEYADIAEARAAGLEIGYIHPYQCRICQEAEYVIQLWTAKGELWAEGTGETASSVRWHINNYVRFTADD